MDRIQQNPLTFRKNHYFSSNHLEFLFSFWKVSSLFSDSENFHSVSLFNSVLKIPVRFNNFTKKNAKIHEIAVTRSMHFRYRLVINLSILNSLSINNCRCYLFCVRIRIKHTNWPIFTKVKSQISYWMHALSAPIVSQERKYVSTELIYTFFHLFDLMKKKNEVTKIN